MMTAEYLLPSEIARLILGYLKEKGLKKTQNSLLRECPDLQEYWRLLYSGKVASTNVMGLTLTDMLNEFYSMKLASRHQEKCQRDAAQVNADLLERLAPGHSYTDTGTQGLSVARASVPLTSCPPPSFSSMDSSPLSVVNNVVNAGYSSSSRGDNKDLGTALSNSSNLEVETINSSAKALSCGMAELEDPLERLLGETKLHEQLAESINRALKDSSFLDEIDEAISQSESDSNTGTLKRKEGSAVLETSSSQVVKANIDSVVELTILDPKFEELLTLVEQDVDPGKKAEKILGVQTPELRQDGHKRSWEDTASEDFVDRTDLNSENFKTSGSTNHSTSAQKLERTMFHSNIMPPPSEECSRRSRLKRVPKKSLHKPFDSLHYNAAGKESIVLKDLASNPINHNNINNNRTNNNDNNNTPYIPSDKESISTLYSQDDENSPGSNDIAHVAGSMSQTLRSNERHNSEDIERKDSKSRLAASCGYMSSGKTSEKMLLIKADNCNQSKSRISDHICHGSVESCERTPKKCVSDQDLTNTDVHVSSCTLPSSSTVTQPSYSLTSAKSVRNKETSPPEIISVSNASCICSVDENSLSVFSLIEKNIAEMHGETFVPRHLRNQPSTSNDVAMISTSITTTVASNSTSCTDNVSTNATLVSEVVVSASTVSHSSVSGTMEAKSKEEIQPSQSRITSLPNSSPQSLVSLVVEADRVSATADNSYSDFENQLSTPNAILVRPIGPYPSALQRNYDLVDECLKSCLKGLVKTKRASAPASPSGSAANNDDGNAGSSVALTAASQPEDIDLITLHLSLNGDEEVKEDLDKKDSNSSPKANDWSQRGVTFSPLQEKIREGASESEQAMLMRKSSTFDTSNTISVPFTGNKISDINKWSRKFNSESSGACECTSLPAFLPSMAKSYLESQELIDQSSSRPSAFKPLSSTFSKPAPFMSPPSIEQLSTRKVISVDCLHSPYIPAHCKKIPSRRITPVEVSYLTPSPLQVPSPSSPHYVIDMPSSPSVPASPLLASSYNLVCTSPLVKCGHTRPSSPSPSSCHRKSLEPSPKSLSKNQLPLSLQVDNMNEERSKPTNTSILSFEGGPNRLPSGSNSMSLDIKMPSSPSQRKPRRIVPKMLTSYSSKAQTETPVMGLSTGSTAFDDAKTVSSSSDLSHPSEAEAFRILKSHLFTFSKPHSSQEISSSSPASISKCGCTSQSNCKHRKKKGRRSPGLDKSLKSRTPSKNAIKTQSDEIGPNGNFPKNHEVVSVHEMPATTKVFSRTDDGIEFQDRDSRSSAVDNLGKGKPSASISNSDFITVGIVEIQPSGTKSSSGKVVNALSEGVEDNSNGAEDQTLFSQTHKTQEGAISKFPRIQINSRYGFSNLASSPTDPGKASEATSESIAFADLTFENLWSEKSQMAHTRLDQDLFLKEIGIAQESTQFPAGTTNHINILHQNQDLDLNECKKPTRKQSKEDQCIEKHSDPNKSEVGGRSTLPSAQNRQILTNVEMESFSADRINSTICKSTSQVESNGNTELLPDPSVSEVINCDNVKAVDSFSKEFTVDKLGVKFAQKDDGGDKEELNSRTAIEVSAPYFPELSNTLDFFSRHKSKCFNTNNPSEQDVQEEGVKAHSNVKGSNFQSLLHHRNIGGILETIPENHDIVSQSSLQLTDVENRRKVPPLSPDAMMGCVSLLRQAMDECDIPCLPPESNSSSHIPPAGALPAQLATACTAADTMPSCKQSSPGGGKSASGKNPSVGKRKPKPTHPAIRRSTQQRSIRPRTIMGSSRFPPLCPKTLPAGNSIVYVQHGNEMVPFLIPPTGLPVMLPQSLNPAMSPTLNTERSYVQNTTPVLHTQNTVVSIPTTSVAMLPSSTESLQTEFMPLPNAVALPTQKTVVTVAETTAKALYLNRKVEKHCTPSTSTHKKESSSSKNNLKDKNATSIENYTPQQKIGVRRREGSGASTPEDLQSSYFKKGLRVALDLSKVITSKSMPFDLDGLDNSTDVPKFKSNEEGTSLEMNSESSCVAEKEDERDNEGVLKILNCPPSLKIPNQEKEESDFNENVPRGNNGQEILPSSQDEGLASKDRKGQEFTRKEGRKTCRDSKLLPLSKRNNNSLQEKTLFLADNGEKLLNRKMDEKGVVASLDRKIEANSIEINTSEQSSHFVPSEKAVIRKDKTSERKKYENPIDLTTVNDAVSLKPILMKSPRKTILSNEEKNNEDYNEIMKRRDVQKMSKDRNISSLLNEFGDNSTLNEVFKEKLGRSLKVSSASSTDQTRLGSKSKTTKLDEVEARDSKNKDKKKTEQMIYGECTNNKEIGIGCEGDSVHIQEMEFDTKLKHPNSAPRKTIKSKSKNLSRTEMGTTSFGQDKSSGHISRSLPNQEVPVTPKHSEDDKLLHISPFSGKRSSSHAGNEGRNCTSIYDIVKNVYTGLEKNKLKDMSRKKRIPRSPKKGKRRNSPRSAAHCKDYYESTDSGDFDNDERSTEESFNLSTLEDVQSNPDMESKNGDGVSIIGSAQESSCRKSAQQCTKNVGKRKICNDKNVSIAVIDSCDEVIDFALVDHNPFPIYESPNKKSPPVLERKSHKSVHKKLARGKASTSVAQKPSKKPVSSHPVEVISGEEKSSQKEDRSCPAEEQEELNKALLALEQVNMSWSEPNWINEVDPDIEFMALLDLQVSSNSNRSPVKCRPSVKIFSPTKTSAAERDQTISSFSDKTGCRDLHDTKDISGSNSQTNEFQSGNKSSGNDHKCEEKDFMNVVIENVGHRPDTDQKKKRDHKARRKRKISDPPDIGLRMNKGSDKLTDNVSVTVRKKFKKGNNQTNLKSGLGETNDNDKKFRHLQKHDENVHFSTGEVNSMNFVSLPDTSNSKESNSSVNNVRQVDLTVSPKLSEGVSYLSGITQSRNELDGLNGKASTSTRNSVSSVQFPEHEDHRKLDGLELVSGVAVETRVATDLAQRFERQGADSSQRTESINIMSTKYAPGGRSERLFSPKALMQARSIMSSDTNDLRVVSSLKDAVVPAPSPSLPLSDIKSPGQSSGPSLSPRKQISLSAMNRLMKKLYKGKKS